MRRLTGVVLVVAVVVVAMAFAAANAGNRATLDLGLFAFYRIPVTLVAFSGLLVGMLVMFAVGIQSDLKVRKILRDRLAEETREEQVWIDRNQRDLFAQDTPEEGEGEPLPAPVVPTAMVAPAPDPSLSSVDSQAGEEAGAEASGDPAPQLTAEEDVRAKPMAPAESPETQEGEPEPQ